MTIDPNPPDDCADLVQNERALLGSLLRWPAAIDDVASICLPDFCRKPHHREILATIYHLHGSRQVDVLTVCDELRNRDQLAGCGGYSFVAALWDEQPTGANAVWYARQVRDAHCRLNLALLGGELALEDKSPSGDVATVLGAAESRLWRLSEIGACADVVDLAGEIDDAFERLDARQQRRDCMAGVATGLDALDGLLAGLQPSELVVIAARPSIGKTALALTLARAMAVEGGVPLFFASLEQSRRELADRLLCMQAEVEGQALRRGTLGPGDADALRVAGQKLRKAPLYFDDAPAQSVLRIAANSRRLKRQKKIQAVLIDYLQLIDPEDKRVPRHEQVACISRRLKCLARELAMPVVALAQLNRGLEDRGDRRPRLSDLRESGAIEADADTVLLLHKPEEVAGPILPMELLIAKQRNGPTGEVKLVYRRGIMRFEDAPTHGPQF